MSRVRSGFLMFDKRNFLGPKWGMLPFLKKSRGRTPELFVFANDFIARNLLFCACRVLISCASQSLNRSDKHGAPLESSQKN